MKPCEILALTPAGLADPAIAIAAGRAGATGVLDLEFVSDPSRALQAVREFKRLRGGARGVLLDSARPEVALAVLGDALRGLGVAVFTAHDLAALGQWVPSARDLGLSVWIEVADSHAARVAEELGAGGLIAKGNEAGGWVSRETTFILLQRLLAETKLPVLARGGIGLHSAAACWAGGAAGVVLDAQLLLSRESRVAAEVRETLERMDGSETAVAGDEVGTPFRFFAPGGPAAREELRAAASHASSWRAVAAGRVAWDTAAEHVWPVGEDAARAASLAQRYHTVGGIVAALREAVGEHVRAARRARPLAEHSPLARSHGTRFPIVQGPMSRVSDRPEFARAVADEGAMPCLAVGLMTGREAGEAGARTAERLDGAPWGVGLMGFMPRDVWAEQVEAVAAHGPRIAVIAGGRPDQALELERQGVAAYLHTPTPGLLRLFLEAGVRRFVFEGRECGGHVGPLGSLGLWDAVVDLLARELTDEDAARCHVLFAGGIHDNRSAAMVASLAAPLAERGVKLGVLLGSAYLFTREAVDTGAIRPAYQEQVLGCDGTVLLESGPGHALRCVPGPCVAEFEASGHRMREEGRPPDEISLALQAMCVEGLGGGLYVIGQLAALRRETTTIGRLHHEVCVEGTHLIESREAPSEAPARPRPAAKPSEIAIVGMSCILPGAPDLSTYWANIVNRVCAITEVPPSHWDPELVYTADRFQRDRTYSKWGGFFDPVPFDPAEWGLPPNSVASIDPMQLVALIAAREALKDAGYLDRPFDRSRAAVILGVTSGLGELGGLYVLRTAFPLLFGADAWGLLDAVGDALPQWTEDSFPGIIPNVVAGRISNRLDLTGPNYVVDAACASSLAAVDVAIKELAVGEADMALVGGVDCLQGLFGYYCFSATQAFSPRGEARVFDEGADGVVTGEGAAMLVLKHREAAERDGDRIYALIQGVGSSSDGRARGLTAPRPEGQLEALRRAYRRSGLSPATVGLFEAHGTGTVAGDRSEAQALRTLAEEAGARPRSQAVGSVKSMIGHTKATAGVAGLVKAALALRHKALPPTLGVAKPLPGAGFEDGPLYINTEVRPWLRQPSEGPRRAGVSAFGFGGTNFHAVLEEYQDDIPGTDAAFCDEWPAELLVWSAPSAADLARALEALAGQLDGGAAPRLRDVALSLWRRAQRQAISLALAATSLDDLREKLGAAREMLAQSLPVHDERGIYLTDLPLARAGKVAFVFPGQGSQYPDMLREAALHFPEVRAAFETAAEALDGALSRPLGDYVFPTPAFTADEEQAQRDALTAANIAQPALAAAGMGLFRLLGAFGVRPEMVAGHSFGEYIALAAAGVLDEATLARLAEARGRFLTESLGDHSPGAMAAVQAGADEVAAAISGIDDLWIANRNSPAQTVVSGTAAAVDALFERLADMGLRGRRLAVAGAFHTPLVAGARPRLAEALRAVPFGRAAVDVFSNTTTGRYPAEAADVRALLAEHMVSPVRFADEIQAMYEAGARVFVEVGPRAVLTSLIAQVLAGRPHVAVATDRPDRGGVVQLLRALGQLWAEGVEVDPGRLFAGRDARALDLDCLGTLPPVLSPTTWLVTGCRAWPANKPMPRLPVPLVGDMALSLGRDVPDGGGGADAEIIARHREFMRQLMDTHREVMRWYLAANRPAAPPEEEPAPQADDAGERTAPGADVAVRFMQLVSERTGYPMEMLEPDLHVEADLGIDSIKRVEILGAIQREFLPSGTRLSPDVLEELISLTTLRGVIQWLENAVAQAGRIEAPAESMPSAAAAASEPDAPIRRIVLTRAPAPPLKCPAQRLPAGGTILITDDGRGIARALADRLSEQGTRPVVVSHRPGEATDLTSPRAAELLVRRVVEEHGPLRGIVHLLPLADAPDLAAMDLAAWRDRVLRDVKSLFYLARAAGGDLAAAGDRAWLVAATDPAFPGHGGLAGFLKTAAQEWPGVHCKAVGLGPAEDPLVAAEHLLSEMAAGDGLVEVAYESGVRMTVGHEARELAGDAPPSLEPAADWVFLITGGARGITAEIALEVARQYSPTLVLVGRSPLPGEEDARTTGLSSAAEIKPVLHKMLQDAGAPAGLRQVEQAYARLLRDRETRDNLARLRETGARVEYRRADVRDETALADLLSRVVEEHGRLDVLVHGAGVVEDKLIRDKTPESFDRVFDTKADSMFLLSRLLDPGGVKCLVLLSSTAGALGNRGQADYAAANAVLNEFAAYLDERRPGRVVAQGWGPWARRGMVTPEVARELARQGLSLISPEAGAGMCVLDMTRGGKGEARVVMAAGSGVDAWLRHDRAGDATAAGSGGSECAPMPMLHGARVVSKGDDALDLLRSLDPAHDLYLADHRLDGRPVLPMTFAVELMAEAAKQLRPALDVTELRDFRLLRGVILQNGPVDLRVSARVREGPCDNGCAAVEVQIADCEHPDRPAYRATIHLSDGPPEPPSYLPPCDDPLEPFAMTAGECYERYMFHGPLLRGLVRIEGMGASGAAGLVRASSPRDLLAHRPEGEWLLDPVVFDSGLQLGLVWSRTHHDATPLPARFASCKLFARPAGDMVRCRMHGLRSDEGLVIEANVYLADMDGKLLATVERFEAAASPLLNRLGDNGR